MKLFFCAGLILATFLTPKITAASPAPGVSGTLSIVPGLGQMANGDALEGLGWLGTIAGLTFSRSANLQQVGFDLWMYNMYDAYRDAGPRHSVRGSLLSNWAANINPLNIIDPIGAPIVATGALAGKPRHWPGLKQPKKMAVYSFVGLGEEGLFRGFLFPGFSDLLGSRVVGATLSSSFFALAHATGGRANLKGAVLGQRFIMGLLFCWQTDRNRYDLRKSIFAHTWFDILVDREATQIQGLSFNIGF